MFVNGIPVNTVIDSIQPFASGTIGVRAEARRGPMEAAFEDGIVTAPRRRLGGLTGASARSAA